MVAANAGLWRTYLVQSPIIVVAIVGLGLAAVYQDRVGRSALVMGAAMALLLLDSLLGPLLQVQLPKLMRTWANTNATTVLSALAIARTLWRAIAWAIALWALVGFWQLRCDADQRE